MSRKNETKGDAGVWLSRFGKFSATMPNGTTTMSWPMILRQPLSPRLRCCRSFM
jgi:hypothetical protein